MPRVPKTLPARLRQYYRTAPRPASEFGDDLLGFAADRWGRINRAEEDLKALDDYAVQRRAYGGYNPEALNEMRMSILAARADAARDFDRAFAPRHDAWLNEMRKRNKRVDDLSDFQMAYNRQFVAEPPFRNEWARDREYLRPFVNQKYLERFDNVKIPDDRDAYELADVYEYGLPEEMDRLSYPGTERYLATGIPPEGGIFSRQFVDEANEDLRSWYNANWRDPSDYPSRNFRDYETLNWDDYLYYR